MELTQTAVPTLIEGKVKTIKCKPGQGKLNRTIVLAQKTLESLGHAKRRFKRDYVTGTATYTCPDCGAIAVVTTDKKVTGTAMVTACTHNHGV